MPPCSQSYPNADYGFGRSVLLALHRIASGRIRWQVAASRNVDQLGEQVFEALIVGDLQLHLPGIPGQTW